jgi:excisionase family DNA binding protein
MALLIIGQAEGDLLEAIASQLYTTVQAANYLGIKRQVVHDEWKAGKLRKIFPHGGRTGFFVKSELDDYIALRRGISPGSVPITPEHGCSCSACEKLRGNRVRP